MGMDESDTAVVVSRKIEFHVARKQYNGFSSTGSGNGFKLVTLNPNASNHHKAAVASGSAGKQTERKENLLDQELSFRLTVRRIGAGLRNLGNTCFLNSVLQCLTYTEPLAAYLQSGKHESSCRTAGFCALCAIQKHVSRALQSTGRILEPKDLVSNLRCISRNFRNARQEDAHEYMVNLLESMHKCCLPTGVPSESPSAYEKSLVHKIFGGRLRSQVKCTQCSYSSNKFDPFLDLSLEIARADSVQKALCHFTAKEKLDGGAKQYQCQQCKEKVRALKQLTVYKPPNVLAIHLKRFGSHIPGQKINKDVSFGPNLDMKPFVSGPYDGDLKYTLYGVLVHAGWSTHSGHYYCFVRTSTGMWYSLDDNQVYQVSEKKVLGQKAYMLFYVRDRGNVSAKKPADVIHKEKSVANAAHTKSTPELRVTNQNGILEKGVEGSFSALSKKDALTTSAPKENPSKKICVENKIDSSDIRRDPQLELPSVAPTAENLVECPSATTNSVSLKTEPSSTTEPHSQPQPVIPTAENLAACTSAAASSVSHQAEPKLSNEAFGAALLSGDHKQSVDCNNRLNGAPDINTGKVDKSQRETAPSPQSSSVPHTMSGEVCAINSSNTDPLNEKTIHGEATLEVSNITDCVKPSKKRSIEECQDGLFPNAEPINSPPSAGQPSRVIVKKKQAKLKMKGKHFMHQVSSLTLSSNIIFGGGLQKKRKRNKCLSAQNKSGVVKLVNGTADCGGSAASTKSASMLVDNCIESHRRAATRNSDDDEKTIRKASSNGIILGDDSSAELRKRLNTDSAACMNEKPQNIRKSVDQGPDNSQNHRKKVKQSNIMSILTRGLDETTVARWDGIDVSHAKDRIVEHEQSIGYIGDEWDEEYDRGKKKKIKESKISYEGPNLFQEVAARKKNDRQGFATKKKMTDRRKLSTARKNAKGKRAYRK